MNEIYIDYIQSRAVSDFIFVVRCLVNIKYTDWSRFIRLLSL